MNKKHSLDSFWQAIDLGDNLGRCLKAVRSMYGMQAGVMAIITALIAIATGALAWTFDIISTIEATTALAGEIETNIPANVAQLSGLVVLGITFAPTLMEFGGAMFAREGATPFQWIVTALSAFDLLTDAPATSAFLARFNWTEFGVFEWPAYIVVWVCWLGMASFFFEMVCACAITTTVALVLRSFAKGPAQQVA